MGNTLGPRIVEVAEEILADIRGRKLRPGAAYPDTMSTARRLHVSGSTVNRAFQLLAQRGVVQRRQRQGTIVLDPSVRLDGTALQRVHLIVREDHLRTEGLWANGVLLGLQGALPGTELQFNFRPQIEEADYVNQLIGEVLRTRRTAGFVLIRSTVVTQRLVAASGLPAVISGTPQPSINDLPSVDRDQQQIGVLLAKHLLGERCQRYLILMRERLTAGDHAMLDGALATLAAANVSLANVTLRCLPTDAEAIRASAVDLLASDARAGCLCRSEPLARGVADAAKTLKLKQPQRPTIVVADVAQQQLGSGQNLNSPFPWIEPIVEPREWGAALGRALAAVAIGKRPEPFHQVIPVRLQEPKRSNSNRQ